MESCLPRPRIAGATYGGDAAGRSALCAAAAVTEAESVTMQQSRSKKEGPLATPGYTISASCMSCGVCGDICPHSAIVEARRQFVIRRSSCDACGICVRFCPVRAIVRRS